jgi:hypothetical protein
MAGSFAEQRQQICPHVRIFSHSRPGWHPLSSIVRGAVGPFHCWAAIRESRIRSECTMGTIYEKACPWVGDILDVCTGDRAGAGPWQRCCLGCRFGRGGVRPGGRGGRRGRRIYRWAIHCSFLGVEKVRFEANGPGEIPRRYFAKPYQPKSAADGGKPGAIGNRGGCAT